VIHHLKKVFFLSKTMGLVISMREALQLLFPYTVGSIIDGRQYPKLLEFRKFNGRKHLLQILQQKEIITNIVAQ